VNLHAVPSLCYHPLGLANWKALRCKLLEVVEALMELSLYSSINSILGICFLETVTDRVWDKTDQQFLQ